MSLVKAHHRLLEAFSQVRGHTDINLVNVGVPRRKYTDDLRLIKQLGLESHVTLTGYAPQDDLVALYNLAELVAFPSIYESFPAIPLEANACGCPVVTSPTGGTRESAGDAAIYVDPTQADDIAKGILEVLTHPEMRADLVERGFRNVSRFSWEKTARETLQVLESINN